MGERERGDIEHLLSKWEAETAELLAALKDESSAEGTVLSHVFMRYDSTGGYDVRLRDGTLVLHLDRNELAARPVAEVVRDKMEAMVCSACGTRLIPGEVGMCGPCEAKTTMDLIRMRDEFGG